MVKLPSILELPADDTIVAIATPAGRSALGIVRLSGPSALVTASQLCVDSVELEKLSGGSARVCEISLSDGLRDTTVLTIWRRPKSYTGQDMVEFTLHGSPVLLAAFERAVIELGARPAAPGEFTLRAILNGKMALSEAGAISALIEAPGLAAARAASRTLGGELARRLEKLIAAIEEIELVVTADTEFPEDIEGVNTSEIILIIEALQDKLDALRTDIETGMNLSRLPVVVIAGPPNVGKSTLANALLRRQRSIVHHEPGTTRDLIEAECSFGDISALLVDTAGLRETADGIEAIGVDLAHRRLSEADMVLLLLDGSEQPNEEETRAISRTEDVNRLIVLNKTDIGLIPRNVTDVAISAKTGKGIDELREIIARGLCSDESEAIWAAAWQTEQVKSASEAITSALDAARNDALDAATEEIAEAANCLRTALGEEPSDDIIARVLDGFCIGK